MDEMLGTKIKFTLSEILACLDTPFVVEEVKSCKNNQERFLKMLTALTLEHEGTDAGLTGLNCVVLDRTHRSTKDELCTAVSMLINTLVNHFPDDKDMLKTVLETIMQAYADEGITK